MQNQEAGRCPYPETFQAFRVLPHYILCAHTSLVVSLSSSKDTSSIELGLHLYHLFEP